MQTFYFRHNALSNKPVPLEKTPIYFNELTVVIKGELSYVIDEKPLTVKAGDCLYLTHGAVRQRLYSENAEYISFNFYDVIPRLLPTHFIDAVSAEIKMLLTVCDEIFLKHVDWPHKIDKALELIFYLLEDRYASIDENPTTATIKRFIKNNLKNKLTLYDIARHVGYSPCHCDTLFKKETGYSIIKYLVNERICEAKRLLEEGTLSLKNIAESVGFEDYNFFSRTFKKFTGRTPTEYKSLKNHKSKIK